MAMFARGGVGRSMALILSAAITVAKGRGIPGVSLEKPPAEKIIPRPTYHRYFNQIVRGHGKLTPRNKKVNRLHLSKKAKIARRKAA